tara:strand:- start:175 stop:777 length:603 start_codon:yes stop_codon:yes gene_type:complete
MKLKNITYSNYDYDEFIYESYNIVDANKKVKEYIKNNTYIPPILNTKLSHINIYYPNTKQIIVTTPIMVVPFGLEGTNNFQIKLQFTNFKSNDEMNDFFNFIKRVELNNIKYIGLEKKNLDMYKSQIYQDNLSKYDPLLVVKIPFINNKFNVNVYNDTYNLNVTNIHKFSKVKCDIYIDSIWLFNGKFICKWKLLNIYIL